MGQECDHFLMKEGTPETWLKYITAKTLAKARYSIVESATSLEASEAARRGFSVDAAAGLWAISNINVAKMPQRSGTLRGNQTRDITFNV